ncbi:MAG: C-terminal binding protein [Christensenellales bacterium]
MGMFYVARVDAAKFQNDDPMTDEAAVLVGMEDVRLLRLFCENEREIIEKAQDADVIVTHFADLTETVFAALPRLKAVVRYGVGYDSVDVEGATKHGVLVVNVPDFCGEEVSNHVMAFLLAYAKKVVLLNAMTKDGAWEQAKQKQKPMRCLHGETLGIIGCGNLGRSVAAKAQALKMHVIGYDKYLPPEAGESCGIEMVSLQELYERADYISLHVTLTEETKHLINKAALEQMKKQCVIVNTSRGPVVDESALIEALRNGTIEGACLDVFEQEPIDSDNPLLKMEQVLVTPHDASYSDAAFLRLKRSVMEESLRVKDGKKPCHIVNTAVLGSEALRLKLRDDAEYFKA